MQSVVCARSKETPINLDTGFCFSRSLSSSNETYHTTQKRSGSLEVRDETNPQFYSRVCFLPTFIILITIHFLLRAHLSRTHESHDLIMGWGVLCIQLSMLSYYR